MNNKDKREIGNKIIEFVRKKFNKLTDLEIQRLFCTIYVLLRKNNKIKNAEKKLRCQTILNFVRKHYGKLTDLELQRIFSNLYSRFRKSGK